MRRAPSRNRLLLLCLPLAAVLPLVGCAELLYGGDTVRVSGVVTSEGLPAVGREVRLIRAGAPNVILDADETDDAGAYGELVVFGQSSCDAVRVATRPPGVHDDGGWTERVVHCGDNRVDFSF